LHINFDRLELLVLVQVKDKVVDEIESITDNDEVEAVP